MYGLHLERHVGDRGRVVRTRHGQPTDDHVGVADRLDLLEPELLGELVECGEDVIEQIARPRSATSARTSR